MEQRTIQQLMDFIDSSPSVYHVTENLSEMLEQEGYIYLSEGERWIIQPGGKYYVIRGGSTLVAFRIPLEVQGIRFRIVAAHSDSPCFKLKSNAELTGEGYLRLNTEKYGGMRMSSWMDRPLSVAGRVFVRDGNGISSKLVNLDRDLLVIPSLAIHMDRDANDGKKLLANVDTLPIMGDTESEGALNRLIAEAAGADAEDILDGDLFLYCRSFATVAGVNGEYLISPKLDDLECAWAAMKGFLESEGSTLEDCIPVCCIFDNEEVGSGTKQGAASSTLRDVLRRVCLAEGGDEESFLAMLAGSFLVSADNAHALHPNHPEYSDRGNHPIPNKGVVIKYNANQRYATDGFSGAFFRAVCAEAGIPVQVYANRSDLPGGTTLGSLADTLVPVPTVDIGLAQLAMHSAVETAGTKDLLYLVKALKAYYGFSGTETF